MKEEILSIASDLREGHITSNEAKRLLLVLFRVSGRSEQLICTCDTPAEVAYPNGTIFCEECGLNVRAD
jgi:hypothetical protein